MFLLLEFLPRLLSVRLQPGTGSLINPSSPELLPCVRAFVTATETILEQVLSRRPKTLARLDLTNFRPGALASLPQCFRKNRAASALRAASFVERVTLP